MALLRQTEVGVKVIIFHVKNILNPNPVPNVQTISLKGVNGGQAILST